MNVCPVSSLTEKDNYITNSNLFILNCLFDKY